MQDYPSLERGVVYKGKPIYAFDKLDGSQIRAEWAKKKKFWKFGTRKHLIDAETEGWGEAVVRVFEKYEKDLHDIFVKQRYQKVTCFFEFAGRNSFAGVHEKEKHDVTLFDVRVSGKGILLPKDFLKLTKNVETPKMLYYGNANEVFVDVVKKGELEGMTFEGVVCKSQEYKTPGRPWMFKLKNSAWLARLRKRCEGNEVLFKKLA